MDSKALKTKAELSTELLQLSVEFNGLLAKHSIPTSVNVANVRRLIETKSDADLRVFFDRIRFFYDVCAQAHASSGALEEKQLLWSCMTRLGVRPPSDLFERIDPTDYVEIYDAQGIQVFRNFEFCRLITYTLDEILTYGWDELYERSQDLTSTIFGEVARMFGSKATVADLAIPTHTCAEKLSGSGRSFEVKMKFFAPLFKGSDPVYLLAASTIERKS
jgi:PAS domain-containing protein